MKRYQQEAVEAEIRPVDGPYLRVRQQAGENSPAVITVCRGEEWTPLACKEVYGRAVKAAMEQDFKSCLFDLTAAGELGLPGLCAAVEGVYGGAYRKHFTLTDQWEPDMVCYAGGAGWTDEDLRAAVELARSVMEVRNLVNRPANLLPSDGLARALAALVEGLPVETRLYGVSELEEKGLGGLLTVGNSSGHPPMLAVLRYNGAPESPERLGFVGKGVAVDTGGYSLKSPSVMAGIKGDMAGGAAAAAAVRALAACGARVNVTAVVPCCENRISPESAVPGDLIRSFSGKTIEILNTDAEGRLILADGLTWAVREEKCTRLVDIATLTGAIAAMLGQVASGVMANDDGWYGCLEQAAALSGEKFWRMPGYREYEQLIESDLGDLRNTSKEGCGSVTAGLFLQHFTEGLPWLHLDIAGTADVAKPVWQHQGRGATGTAVSTLFYLAKQMAS
ncbi:MAG: leucyl aminopeptidase family protein [Oscillospiraceae bacterium]|nr:leucyl aminopeptidase family protein [Oscillospiraceae bacterium]